MKPKDPRTRSSWCGTTGREPHALRGLLLSAGQARGCARFHLSAGSACRAHAGCTRRRDSQAMCIRISRIPSIFPSSTPGGAGRPLSRASSLVADPSASSRPTLCEYESAVERRRRPPAAQSGKLGLSVRPLTAEERREANLAGGLIVEDVQGPAARAGIQPGDLILALNGTPVKNAEELRALAGKPAKSIALLVQRGDAKMFIPVHTG